MGRLQKTIAKNKEKNEKSKEKKGNSELNKIARQNGKTDIDFNAAEPSVDEKPNYAVLKNPTSIYTNLNEEKLEVEITEEDSQKMEELKVEYADPESRKIQEEVVTDAMTQRQFSNMKDKDLVIPDKLTDILSENDVMIKQFDAAATMAIADILVEATDEEIQIELTRIDTHFKEFNILDIQKMSTVKLKEILGEKIATAIHNKTIDKSMYKTNCREILIYLYTHYDIEKSMQNYTRLYDTAKKMMEEIPEVMTKLEAEVKSEKFDTEYHMHIEYYKRYKAYLETQESCELVTSEIKKCDEISGAMQAAIDFKPLYTKLQGNLDGLKKNMADEKKAKDKVTSFVKAIAADNTMAVSFPTIKSSNTTKDLRQSLIRFLQCIYITHNVKTLEGTVTYDDIKESKVIPDEFKTKSKVFAEQFAYLLASSFKISKMDSEAKKQTFCAVMDIISKSIYIQYRNIAGDHMNKIYEILQK
jgi:hypothetical protein